MQKNHQGSEGELGLLASNLKFLRRRRGRTQDEVSAALGLKRPTLSGYENGIAQPGLASLIAFADYFNLPVDALIRVDLAKIGESRLAHLERGGEVYIRGSNLRILATTVQPDNEENIELVPEPAKAGYASGFADPGFIGQLPVFRLPFLSNQKKYRSFQISGDSMYPIPDGAWVTGEYIRDWHLIRSGEAAIILTVNDGIVFKIVENLLDSRSCLRLRSLNPLFAPYEIEAGQINELWRFVHFISPHLPTTEPDLPGIFRLLQDIRNQFPL